MEEDDDALSPKNQRSALLDDQVRAFCLWSDSIPALEAFANFGVKIGL